MKFFYQHGYSPREEVHAPILISMEKFHLKASYREVSWLDRQSVMNVGVFTNTAMEDGNMIFTCPENF